MTEYHIVVGYEQQGLIGIGDKLLIECRDDLKRFYEITTSEYPEGSKNIMIMGYKTWLSIPESVKPFKKRTSIVVTKNHPFEDQEGVKCVSSLKGAFNCAKELNSGRVFVIGGSSIFDQCYSHHMANLKTIYVTKYLDSYPKRYVDLKSFNPCILDGFESIHIGDTIRSVCKVNEVDKSYTTSFNHQLRILQRPEDQNVGEREYLKTLTQVLSEGVLTESRNGPVYSYFGSRMVFDLQKGFPLLTTKQMGYKTILRELLWFLRGSTDNQELQDQKVHIWDQNASREFLDSRGLDYPENDLGPVYGFQWRHFGSEYKGSKADYTGQGCDQIKRVLQQIKEEPESRRIILSAWNPPDVDKMALPPCHVMCQFHVNQTNKTLDCQLYQRSGDMFLGVPFNIASYAFLTHIFAHLSGLKAGKLIHVLGDAHIYENHVEQVKTQMPRVPVTFPTIQISDELTDIDTIKEDMIKIIGYTSYPRIQGSMVA